MKRFQIGLLVLLVSLAGISQGAETYVIDTQGMHASINFQIPHLGYSLLTGRFNRFSGEFTYDRENPAKSSVSVVIDTSSVDSNHAERDKHLRSEDFLHTDKFPEATFVSSSFREQGDGQAVINGMLTLRGVSKPVTINATKIGEGEDPWGGYRLGFAGTTTFLLADFGIMKELGESSREVELLLHVEGLRKQ